MCVDFFTRERSLVCGEREEDYEENVEKKAGKEVESDLEVVRYYYYYYYLEEEEERSNDRRKRENFWRSARASVDV